jgi:hypothetical protein
MTQLGDMQFSRTEIDIADTLRLLGSPELSLRALQALPELSRKIQAIGGLGAFQNARHEWQRKQMEEATASETAQEKTIQRRLMGALQVGDFADWNRDALDPLGTLDLIREIRDPAAQLRTLSGLVIAIFRLDGELSPSLRQQVLQLLAEIRKQRVGDPDLETRSQPETLDGLEATVYGIWLWSDPAEARPVIDVLPDLTRCRILKGFLATISQASPRSWRNR